MVLIVGLGNPGPKFKNTRHNVGFLVLDEFSKENSFPDWVESKSTNCLYAKKIISEKEIELVKPLTYMNNSGRTVRAIAKKHNLKSKNIIVIHDDLDLPLGKIKIIRNRGGAGHKGVQSIMNELRTKDFIRIRIGIKSATSDKRQKTSTEKFVLQKFSKEEGKILKDITKKAVEAIEMFLKEGLEKTMNAVNK